MFIFTAKLNRKRAVLTLLLLAVLLCAVVILAGKGGNADAPAMAAEAGTNEQRVSLLTELGWQVSPDPLEERTVVIPKEFTDVYDDYNAIQISQGFDLKEYAGLEATRYTYEVTNHPDADGTVYADMIVYRGRLIAGDIQSAAMDGFMHGLEYPE